ncbi:MAG TPA: mechanosensitive ion channel domain-containing protein, partial [Burkholderiaceae bacterium]|nr:mechanosensitive ion channel domain-containing protein [Burkholderiaceae bacterium]
MTTPAAPAVHAAAKRATELNFFSDLADVMADLRGAAVLWQLAAIALALALGWAVTRWLRNRHEAQRAAAKLTLRVSTPLIALLVLLLLRAALQHHEFNTVLVRVALLWMGTFAVVRLVVHVLRTSFKAAAWIASFERWIVMLLWFTLLLLVTGWYRPVWDWLESFAFPIGSTKVNVAELLAGVVAVGVTLLGALWAGTTIESQLNRADGLDSSTRVVLSRVAKAVLLLVGVLLGLSIVGFPLGALSVFGGALGVGLGLGLQRIASNYVSGFIILLDRSVRIGDMITVDKYYGRVTQITTRYTVVQGFDSSEAIIPNEMLVSTPVQNNTHSDSRTQVKLPVSVSYEGDLDLALRILTECASLHPRVVADPA